MAETPVPPFTPGAVQAGQLLGGRYALSTLLARGGMADVWQARDTVLERQVAVKVLHPHLASDTHFVGRFRSEAVAAARLHHPSIVSIFDTCSEEGVEAIVMELVKGHTLREELDTHGPMDPQIVVDFGADLADALDAAHRAGLVHRDVKPANILLCDDQRVMITDFGIAKIRDEADRTQTGTMLGSVKYLSPEQVDGDPVDARTDVYSLGVVLYESLTGRVPFIADTPAATALARLHNVPTRPRELRPTIPAALDDVVMQALARDPEERFPTAEAMSTALLSTRVSTLHRDPDPTAVAPQPTTRVDDDPDATTWSERPQFPTTEEEDAEAMFGPTRSRRRWGTAILALLLVGAALGVAIVLITQTSRDPSSTTATEGGEDGQPTSSGVAPLQVVASSFDPVGGDGEGDEMVGLVLDGNGDTRWHTEYYPQRDFFGPSGKPGVGLQFVLDRSVPLDKLTVTSPTQDWAAQVYVADTPGAVIAEWGEPVASKSDIKGDATFDLQKKSGKYVLLWITDLGTGPKAPQAVNGADNYVQISDVALQGG